MTWLVGALIVVAIAVIMWWSRHRNGDEDMGYVSGQWLAEYRQDRNP